MLPASGPRRSHATAAAPVAHWPLLLSGLDLCTPIHGSMRRAGVLILREALLGPQLNSGPCQSDDLFPRCASPPLQTCIRANGCLVRVPHRTLCAKSIEYREDLGAYRGLLAELHPRRCSSCSGVHVIASDADAPAACARTGRRAVFPILRASCLGSSFELEGDLRRFGKPITMFFHVVSVAARDYAFEKKPL